MTTMLDEWQRLRTELERATSTWGRGVYPPLNIYDNGEAFLVRAEIPGIRPEAIEVTAKGNQVTIGGERTIRAAAGEAAYHRRERDDGRFRRTVTLPEALDTSKVQAAYREGVLELVIPRAPESRPRRIQIG